MLAQAKFCAKKIVVCTLVRDNRALVAKNVASEWIPFRGVPKLQQNILNMRKNLILLAHIGEIPYLCTQN